MDYLMAHGTGSAGKILASQKLLGGSKAAALLVEKGGALGGNAPPNEIFFSKMNIGQSPNYAGDTATTLSYARRPAKPKDVRGVLFFSPASNLYADKGSYAVITADSVALSALDPQIFVFIKEDLPAVQDGQDALRMLLSRNGYFVKNATDADTALHYYPAVMPLKALSDASAFDNAIRDIIASAKSFGFCYTYDSKGKVI
jgi:hypothetical protein